MLLLMADMPVQAAGEVEQEGEHVLGDGRGVDPLRICEDHGTGDEVGSEHPLHARAPGLHPAQPGRRPPQLLRPVTGEDHLGLGRARLTFFTACGLRHNERARDGAHLREVALVGVVVEEHVDVHYSFLSIR